MFDVCVPANVELYSIFVGLFRRFLCFLRLIWSCSPYLPFIYFCFNIPKNKNIRSIFIENERMFCYDEYIIKDYKEGA